MTNRQAAVMIAAGGTGGHVFPALAVCEQLREQQVPVIWLGTARGIESRVVPEAGFNLAFIEVSGFRGKSPIKQLQSLWSLGRSLLVVSRLISEHRVAVVLGFGGYVSAAAGVAAVLRRKPLLLQEQNSVAGTTNRLLSRFAKQIFSGLPGAFTNAAQKVVDSGNPLRGDIVEAARRAAELGQRQPELSSSELKIAVLGGSLGAQPINRVLPEALCNLQQRLDQSADGAKPAAITLLHQSGRGHAEGLQQQYREHGVAELADIRFEIVEFVGDMAGLLAATDIVIARAGAITVSELLLMGVPAILIPLPHAIDDHQLRNAEFVVAAGAAVLMPQSELTPAQLADALYELLVDAKRRDAMAAAASALAKPSAAAEIAAACGAYCQLEGQRDAA